MGEGDVSKTSDKKMKRLGRQARPVGTNGYYPPLFGLLMNRHVMTNMVKQPEAKGETPAPAPTPPPIGIHIIESMPPAPPPRDIEESE